MRVLIFWTALRGSQNSSVPLSQVMNHGFCSTTPRQNFKFRKNEQIQNEIDAHLFFDSQGIVHKEFVPPGQTVNQIFIGKSLKDSGKGWHVCDQALHTLGCCTTRIPHVTRQSPSMNVCRKKHSCGVSAPLFAGSQSL